MNLTISENGKELLLDGLPIFKTAIKIYGAEVFDENRIIVHIFAEEHDIICIDRLGQVIWYAESITPTISSPYQSFGIRDGFIFGTVDLPGIGRKVKLDPNNGKILEEELWK